MIGLSFLLLLLLAKSEATEEANKNAKNCTIVRDVDVILEIPETGRVEALEDVKKFISILAYKAARSCWRPRIRIAGSEVYNINSFDCYSEECISTGVKLLEAESQRLDINGHGNIVLTLQDMTREAFENESIPGLDGPRRIVLLILSSKQNTTVSVFPHLINQLLEGGYDFIAVGIGHGQGESLIDIASRNNRIMALDGFNQLSKEDKIGDIVKIIDNPHKRDPTPQVVQSDYVEDGDRGDRCDFTADIAFLIDSSGSINQDTHYMMLKDFVIQLANSFKISKSGAHAGAVVFSDKIPYTKVTVKLNDHFTNDAFKTAIRKSPYMGYRTRIDLALDLVKDQLFVPEYGARNNVSKIVILLTDGRQNPVRTYDPIESARNLIKQGVTIFAVGITREIDHEQLEMITGESERVFYADTFHELASNMFIRKITQSSCRAAQYRPDVVVTIIPETTQATQATTIASTTTPSPTGCDIHDNEQCNLYEHAKEQYCPQIWLQTNCKYLCGVCYAATEEPETPETAEPMAMSNHTNTGVGMCMSCCHGHDVYVNIFKAGSGANYIMQGMKLQQSTHKQISGVALPPKATRITKNGRKISMDQLINIVQQALPGKPSLAKTIEELVKASKKDTYAEFPTSRLVGIPSIVARTQRVDRLVKEKKRKRRSVELDDIETARLALSNITKNAGCNLFLAKLKEYGLLRRMNRLIMNGREVAIFCPIDAAFQKMYRTKPSIASEKDILLNHIAVKHDRQGTMYKTLLSGGRIILTPAGKENGKILWKANGVDLITALTDGSRREIIITKDVIYPKTLTIIDVLKTNDNLSIFYELLMRSSMKNIFKATDVTKICFDKDTCVSMSRSMRRQVKDAISFNQFTIMVPTDDTFNVMKKSKLKSLMKDSKMRKEFLQEHIFLGILVDSSHDHRGIAYSISPSHSVLMMNKEKGKIYFVHSDRRLFMVKQSVPVVEGVLHIVGMPE